MWEASNAVLRSRPVFYLCLSHQRGPSLEPWSQVWREAMGSSRGKTTSESPWLQHIHLPARLDDLRISTFWAVTQY